MNQLAVLVLGAAALLLHLAIAGLATPLLAAFEGGRMRPPSALSPAAWQRWFSTPFAELGALAARGVVRSDGASAVSIGAPILSLALTMAAAALVPSFATGMLDAPLADLPLVLALLIGARLVLLFAAVDEGLASPGLAAVGVAVDALLAAPALVLAAFMLALLAGGTGLATLLSSQHGLAQPGGLAEPGGLACAAALALAAIAGGGRGEALSQTLSGVDLAVFRLQTGLQRLVWIDLVGALAWPGSLCVAQSGPLHWLLALLLWVVRLSAGMAVLSIVAAGLHSVQARRGLAGLALLLSLLAPILLLARQASE